MKKCAVLVLMVAFVLVSVRSAQAIAISFLAEDYFQGVDDTSGFSTTDTMSKLGKSELSLLGGKATLLAISQQPYSSLPSDVPQDSLLTHRGTRGLGVFGGTEDDEIDWNYIPGTGKSGPYEAIGITFHEPGFQLAGLEFRSLFVEDFRGTAYPEYAYVSASGYNGFGSDEVYNAVKNAEYGARVVTIDELEADFDFVNDGGSVRGLFFSYTQEPSGSNDFALARIWLKKSSSYNAEPVPEPATMAMFGLGLLGLAGAGRKKKVK